MINIVLSYIMHSKQSSWSDLIRKSSNLRLTKVYNTFFSCIMNTEYGKARLLDEDSNFSQETLQTQTRIKPLHIYCTLFFGLLLAFSMTLNLLQGAITLSLFRASGKSYQETKYVIVANHLRKQDKAR